MGSITDYYKDNKAAEITPAIDFTHSAEGTFYAK